MTARGVFDDASEFAAVYTGGAMMGLDLGTKTIGISVSDTIGQIASPLKTLKRTKFGKDADALGDLIDARQIAAVVVGLPKNMDGTEGPRAQSTRAFCKNLSDRLPLPILLWDERLSTVAAERALLEADTSRRRRGEVVDHVAAGFILQGALDRLAHIRITS